MRVSIDSSGKTYSAYIGPKGLTLHVKGRYVVIGSGRSDVALTVHDAPHEQLEELGYMGYEFDVHTSAEAE